MRFRVAGRVQGVGFRWWACDRARELGLAGHVRNDPDGAVSGEAEGGDAQVEAFRRLLSDGPAQARIADLDWVLDKAPTEGRESLPLPFPFPSPSTAEAPDELRFLRQ